MSIRTRSVAGQADLDEAAIRLFGIFQAREEEFYYNPNVVVEYPDISDAGTSLLLSGPIDYINGRIEALERDGKLISRVAILTTFGDKLAVPLSAAGYSSVSIDMPAGPDFTHWFEIERANSEGGHTLYLEAVDETDEKIRPSFVIELHDEQGQLRGGACGAIHERDGARFCYLATLTLDAGLPSGTGTALGRALIAFLRAESVGHVHLGTQTAGPFYETLGFRVTHELLRALRVRQVADGSQASSNLVMMEMAL
ncbi:MAG: GNAT family N-acetyltransferase [Rhizobiaceae bacterium]|nr:GNAT family N-acetyltransferase [Rhizobiaceae bacterium]